MADKPAQAFLSYAHADDEFLEGGITWLRRELQRGMQALTGEAFEIFQDADGIAFGEHWPSRIEDALEGARFLIPILSPSYFTSTNCCAEAATFLELEQKAGRQDLILPIYLIEADILQRAEQRENNAIARIFHDRQYADWRNDAFDLRSSPRIKQRAFELAKQIKEASQRVADDAAPIVPEQGPGVRFRVNEDGLIDRAPDEPHDPDENEARLNSLKTGLIEACDRLLGSSGHNALGFVLDTIRAYRDAIDRPLVDVQYTDVWRHGQRLQNLADAATRDVDRLEPSLEDDQHAALNDLLDLHGPFMLSTAEGRALQAMADRYQATREQQERQKEAVQAFKEAIEDSTGLVTDEVKKVIAEASDELGKGRFPEREAITAQTTNRNFLSTAGKAAAYVSDHAAGGIIGGVAAGTVIGSGLIGASIDALNLAGEASRQFLLTHQMVLKGLVASSTDSLAWLIHLIGWLRRRALTSTVRPAPEDALAIGEKDFWTPGYVFRDIDEPWCPEMVVIPVGEFMMGSPEEEPERLDSEVPQRRVTISWPFALGRFPVTFEEYDHFCEEVGRDQPGDHGWGRGRRPAIHVSWHDAKDYCDWLSEQTGRLYRLPNEAEWEYACRAGSTTAYAFGDEIRSGEANFGSHIGKTLDAGAYASNAFGLYDMHGNVWEWCTNLHNQDRGGPTSDNDPRLGNSVRVVRGGSWLCDAELANSAYRGWNAPVARHTDLGFRCVRVLQ